MSVNPQTRHGKQPLARIWTPTAVSNLALMGEIPLVLALAAHGADPVRSLVGLGVAVGIITVVDSPGLALAATTSAYVPRVGRSRALQRLCLLTGLIPSVALAAILAPAPVAHWLLGTFIHVPRHSIQLTRLALWILAAAPLIVAWRRYQHGLLIAAGQTRGIAYASLVRVPVSGVSTAVVVTALSWSGAAAGAAGLMLGALVEAGLVTAFAAGVDVPAGAPDRVRLAELVRFHLPVAGTVALSNAYVPLFAIGIARGGHAELSLAVWPVLDGMIALLVAPTLDLDSITAARAREHDGRAETGRFAILIGSALAALYLLVALSPAADHYFGDINRLTPRGADLGAKASLIVFATPLLFAVRAWLRGLLLAHRRSGRIQLALAGGITVGFGALISSAIATSIDGAILAAASLMLALLVEAGILAIFAASALAAGRRVAKGPATRGIVAGA